MRFPKERTAECLDDHGMFSWNIQGPHQLFILLSLVLQLQLFHMLQTTGDIRYSCCPQLRPVTSVGARRQLTCGRASRAPPPGLCALTAGTCDPTIATRTLYLCPGASPRHLRVPKLAFASDSPCHHPGHAGLQEQVTPTECKSPGAKSGFCVEVRAFSYLQLGWSLTCTSFVRPSARRPPKVRLATSSELADRRGTGSFPGRQVSGAGEYLFSTSVGLSRKGSFQSLHNIRGT